jgi:peptide/nickel transport system permease protein
MNDIKVNNITYTELEFIPKMKKKVSWKIVLLILPVMFFVLIAIFGPMIIEYDPVKTNTANRLLPPGSIIGDHTSWLGTDQIGRDILTQIVIGARISLSVAVSTVLIGGGIGVILGLLSGYFGGWVDTIIMRIADIQLSFPTILLAILIAGVLGPSVMNVIITLSITRWVTFARVVRGATLAAKNKEFVDSAIVIGASHFRVITKYILPVCLSPLLVLVTVQVGLVIISEASLSFLGLGTPPDNASWGLLISLGRDYISTAWWISVMPGIALAILVVSVGFLGDTLRDESDPYLNN